MPYAKLPEGKINYEISGSGVTVVLIRGLGCNLEHWMGWQRHLEKSYKVIVIDNRGLGKSTVPIRAWHRMSDLARDVAAVLRTERTEKAHIAGVSLGGMIALQFALDFPEMTLSTTAINSSIGGSGHLRMTISAAKALTSHPLSKKEAHQRLAKLLTYPNCSPDLIQKIANNWRGVDSRYANPYATVIAQLIIAHRWRNPKSLSRLKVPVHIISSNQDQFVPRGNSLFLAAKIPNAKLTKIENSGHEPHLDQPETLHRVMSEFFQSVK